MIIFSLYCEIHTNDLDRFKFIESWKEIANFSVKKESSSHNNLVCAWINNVPNSKQDKPECIFLNNKSELNKCKCEFKLNLYLDAFGNKMLNCLNPHNHLKPIFKAEKNQKEENLATKMKIDYMTLYGIVSKVVDILFKNRNTKINVTEIKNMIPEYSANKNTKKNEKINRFLDNLLDHKSEKINSFFNCDELELNEDISIKANLFLFFYKKAESMKLHYFTEDTLHKIREKSKLILISKYPFTMLANDE